MPSPTGRSPAAFRAHARGNGDEALRCFEKALEANDPWLASHGMYGRLLPVDPRVEALLAGELP